MTSTYSTRKRTCPRTPETKPQLFKLFELSPKSSIQDPISCSKKKQINSNKSINRVTSTNLCIYLQGEAKVTALNQMQYLSHEYYSSSINQSELVREKNVQLELQFEKPQHHHLSMIAQNNSIFLSSENEKLVRKSSVDQYQFEKNSYRNHRHSVALGVPYRKCHSSMEQKIVNIINKLKLGKQCLKQIQTLLQRSKKVSTKELSNRFFISGIHVIHKLVSNQATPAHDSISCKIQEVISQLKNRIFEELDSIKAFQTIVEQPPKENHYRKDVLIRRAYKILRRKCKQISREKMQRKSVKIADNFLDKEPENLNNFWSELRIQESKF